MFLITKWIFLLKTNDLELIYEDQKIYINAKHLFCGIQMKIRNLLFLIIIAGILHTFSITLNTCAQIGAPTGGVRDSLPPVLLNANPPNGTLNFDKKQIVLTFNEYVQLQNLQENLLVAPTPKRLPNIDFKLKTVIIKLRDTLQPNTTYSLQLGKSIMDINENNPYPNFTYIFSTGNYIDSLTFSGNVQLAETGKTDTTLLAFLYDDLSDSAVFKSKPKYIARVNNKGDFQFNNLAEDTYHLFALKDVSGQRMYTSEEQLFAFADSPVVVVPDVKGVQLFAYAEAKKPVASTSAGKEGDNQLKYATSIIAGTQDLLTPLTIQLTVPLSDFDSTGIRLTDTLFNPVLNAMISADTAMQTISVATPWEGSGYYTLIIDTTFGTDTLGQTLAKSDTISFRAKKESDYGSIQLNFSNLEKFTNPVLQFVSNNQVVQSFPLQSGRLTQKLFPPGEYQLRILNDMNQNGVWDPGFYSPVNKELQKQPEVVFSITQTLSVKANWDNERDIIL